MGKYKIKIEVNIVVCRGRSFEMKDELLVNVTQSATSTQLLTESGVVGVNEVMAVLLSPPCLWEQLWRQRY